MSMQFKFKFLKIGPVYAYQADAAGKITAFETFCTSVGSPDVRTGAPCLDAHKVICTFLPGKVKDWIDGVIAGN
jgi:hypothetical protein